MLAAAGALAAAALVASGATVAAAEPSSGPLPRLLEAARAGQLADDRHWLRLGHYRRTLGGGQESEADGSGFFLSPRGKVDPALELEATLRGLMAPAGAPDEHAQCRFPARLAFLVRRLEIDPALLPRPECPKLAEWWQRTQAVGVTLVFSSYYLNNPASAFGHTLLRLDRAPFARPGERVELVDLGVNYAAIVDTPNALLYALKGLTGLFHGEFAALPYFYKVREYADFESRDLWEFPLRLEPAAVALLVAHLWELGGTWFDYYYLTENCSYHILGALEAADPRLDLLDHVGKVVIPADTVKALYRSPGLVGVGEVRWRPSARTQLLARVAGFGAAERAAVPALLEDPRAPLPPGLAPAAQAAVLDAAADLVDVHYGKAVIRGEPEAVGVRQAVLERRAAIPLASPPLDLPPPPGGGPQDGHSSARVGLGAGGSRRGGALVLLDARLALHDLADPPGGFLPGSHLEFLHLRARAEGGRPGAGPARLLLDRADLFAASSLSPLDRLDPRISWHIRAGAARIRDGGCAGCLAADLATGGGGTLGLGPAALLLAADAGLQAAPALRGVSGTGWRPGVGPSAVLRLDGGSRLTLVGDASWRWLPGSAPGQTWELSATARLHLGTGAGTWGSLFAEGRRVPGDAEALGGLLVFF